MISCGTLRNSSSKVPRSTVGHSQRLTTSSKVRLGVSTRAAGAGGLDFGDALADDLLAAIGGEHEGGLERRTRRRPGSATTCSPGASTRWPRVTLPLDDVGVGHRHDLGAQKRADPADGPHEGLMLGAPALASGSWATAMLGDDVMRRARERMGTAGSEGTFFCGEDVLVAVGVRACARSSAASTPHLRAKPSGGLGGRCLQSSKAMCGLGAALRPRGWLVGRDGDVGDEGGQAARRGDHAHVAVGESRRRRAPSATSSRQLALRRS